MFTTLGITFWLSWIATILAIISTAGIFPDLVERGGIDLVLSRPIGRTRLFLLKYLSGLLFTALQVTVFTVGSFLVIGLRGGAWEPGLLVAIPIVVVFYSYLFAICAVIGLLTRSTIAALLLTILAWVLVFCVHVAESGLLTVGRIFEQEVTAYDRSLERHAERLATLDDPENPGRFDFLRETIDRIEERREKAVTRRRRIGIAHDVTFVVMTVLPKTTETIGLLERWLVDLADLPDMEPPGENEDLANLVTGEGDFQPDMDRISWELSEIIRGRSVAWVLGSSLGFEAVLLALGAWIFARRDF